MIVWLCSYPRSGNTLLRTIFKDVFGYQTYSRYDDPADIGGNAQTAELVGHIDLGGNWEEVSPKLRASERLHFVKTHDAPESGEKAIYVVRDGRAASVSYLKYFANYFVGAQITLDEVIAGFVNYGSWSSHLDECDPLNRPDTLLVRYEDLLGNPDAQIARIASFCGIVAAHDWKNNFEQARALNPQFFREGSAVRSISAVGGDDLSLFWLFHEDWMRRLGYLKEADAPGADLQAAHRALWRVIAAQRKRNMALQVTVQSDNDERAARAQLRQDAEDRAMHLARSALALAQRDEELRRTSALLDYQTMRADQYRIMLDERARELESANRTITQNSGLVAERDHWAQRAQLHERQLQHINDMSWTTRLADTAFRIAKNARAALRAPAQRVDAKLPRITIVTPVFNGEAHIRDTIESVLSQNYPDLQYIIFDGGSTDGTMRIVDEYHDRLSKVISEPDKGMYDAIAKGFAASDGQVLAYLNADDMYEPGGLLRVGRYFASHPRVQVIYHEDSIDYQGWRFPNASQPPRIDRVTLLKGHILFQDGVFFTRRAYERVGGVNRSMRLAGDWDLWIRLVSRYKFHRVSGHVSCFRMRPGQLSENMKAYDAERDAGRAEWRRRMGARGWLMSQPRHWYRRIYNALWRSQPRRFFYPLQGANLEKAPIAQGEKPRVPLGDFKSPLSRTAPDRLLFSSRDTRFGHPRINYVYYSSADDVAVTWPPMSGRELTALYEKFYSDPQSAVVPPREGVASPWRGYFGGTRLEKLIGRLPMKAWGIKWDESDCAELLDNLPWIARRGANVQLLDVGCFEGKLLDAIKTETDWETFGIDSNPKGIEAARAKGHQVFLGSAEDAALMIPEGLQFDVIHLGQTIEHLDDPLNAMRRLGWLLKPNGVIVLSTPNLDAKQIELFGPTWTHWHVPYHRYLFSRKSLKKMGELSGLEMISSRSYTHPYGTAMSVALNRLGVAGAVPHTARFSDPEIRAAICYTTASRLLWNWRGKGDYLIVVYRRPQ